MTFFRDMQSRLPVMTLLLLLLTALVFSGCTDDDDDDNDDGVSYYGPENTWWHALLGDVPADLAGTGWNNGDTAYNFTLVDQFGNQVELYQFYGRVIVLDLFTSW